MFSDTVEKPRARGDPMSVAYGIRWMKTASGIPPTAALLAAAGLLATFVG